MTTAEQPAPDVLKALIAFAKADAATNALVQGRIFGGELPPNQTPSMPRACVVFRTAGGQANRGTLTVEDYRIDLRTYGATPWEANNVYRTIYTALRYQAQRNVQGDTLLHSATPESGPISLRETDTEWPFEFSSWRVKVALVEVA